MANQAKIRINLDTKEMEIEGSEQFIDKYSPEIRKFLESQSSTTAKRKPGRPPKSETDSSETKTATKKRRGRPKKTEAEKKAAATKTTTAAKAKTATKATKTTKKKAVAKPKTKKEELGELIGSITQEHADNLKKNLPARFGDFFLKLPKDTKDVDKVLAGGFFVQQRGTNATFSTRETTRLLKTVGVKLSNPSQCVKYNEKTGRIKNVRRNRYRLTPLGEKYIVYLLQLKEKSE